MTGSVVLYTLKGSKEMATIFTVGAANKITGITVQLHPGG